MSDIDRPTSRKDFEAGIIAKAWKDPEFNEALTSDPRGVVERELQRLYPGAQLPPNVNVEVHPEDENTIHLVVPRNPQEVVDQALTDEDLDNAAGGTGVGVVVAVVAGAVANTGAAVNQVAGGNINTVGNVNVNANVSVNMNQTTTSG